MQQASTPRTTTGQPPARLRALASAELSLALAELLRTGTTIPRALTAMARRRRSERDPFAPIFESLALGVREEGLSLSQAVQLQRSRFSPRFVALMTLAGLGGVLFREIVEWLRLAVSEFQQAPAGEEPDFPPMQNEVREFCFLFGHLILEKASQTEIHTWLPQVFTARLRLPVTHLLGRFYDQGILLSQAFSRTPPFDDAEMILAVQAGEERNRVGDELLHLSHWLQERQALEDRLRLAELILPDLSRGGESSAH